MYALFTPIFSALIVVPLLCAQVAIAGTINVQGQGQILVKPDRAMLMIGVNTRSNDAAMAQKSNTKTMSALIAALQNMGIQQSDIQTSNFQFQRLSEDDQESSAPKPVYRVSNSVNIVVRDITKIGELIAHAIQVGGNDIGRIEFFVADPKPYIEKARLAAFEDAKTEALASVKAANLKLGPILKISNGRATLPQPLSCYGCEFADAPGDGAQDLQPVTLEGILAIGYTVEVEFEILPLS